MNFSLQLKYFPIWFILWFSFLKCLICWLNQTTFYFNSLNIYCRLTILKSLLNTVWVTLHWASVYYYLFYWLRILFSHYLSVSGNFLIVYWTLIVIHYNDSGFCYLLSEGYWFLFWKAVQLLAKTFKLCRFDFMLWYGGYMETQDISQALQLGRIQPSMSISPADFVRVWFLALLGWI